jgi:hypothetical protein
MAIRPPWITHESAPSGTWHESDSTDQDDIRRVVAGEVRFQVGLSPQPQLVVQHRKEALLALR